MNPVTFWYLATIFKSDKKINMCRDMECDRRDRLFVHGFFVSKREFFNMPFIPIIGKDLLVRLNAIISFGKRKVMAVNIMMLC